MAWIEFHDDIWEHHKTERLADLLGLPIVYTVGHLASLWHFVLRNAWRTSNLEPWGESGIERAARWTGEPGKFVKAARECGFLDGFITHGWMKRAGKLVNDRFYNEERRKNGVLRRKSEATLPYPTLPNPTVITDRATKRVAFTRPGLDEVRLYCQERKSPIDPQHFIDYNEARGWMLGKSKMKDWKATIRNWERNHEFRSGNGSKRVVGSAAVVPGKYDHLG